jgi:hypothetical protein
VPDEAVERAGSAQAEVAPPAPEARRAPSGGLLAAKAERWAWYAALAIAIVVTLGGVGVLYEDDAYWQHRSSDLARQNSTAHEHLLTAQSDLAGTRSQIEKLQAELQNPVLAIWNVPEKLDGPKWYLAGGVPDTFTYHLNATSTGPMDVSIATFEQFAASIECIDAGTGNTDYCMHHSTMGTFKSWLGTTNVSYDFHLAEGCANYLVVFTAPNPITVMPDVTVTYNPSPTFTGDC